VGTSLASCYLATVGGYTSAHRPTYSHLKRYGPHIKIMRSTILSLLLLFVAAGTCLPSRCLALNGGIHLTKPLVYNDRRDTYIQTHSLMGGNPCGGGVEYLCRDPASRRRRRKQMSQIWDSKICSRVPEDSDPRQTKLARASSIYKRQTRPLVREGTPQKQDRNCQKVINIWSWAPYGARRQDLLIDLPSVAMWLWLWWEVSRVEAGWIPPP
jgi:hypothetical protein